MGAGLQVFRYCDPDAVAVLLEEGDRAVGRQTEAPGENGGPFTEIRRTPAYGVVLIVRSHDGNYSYSSHYHSVRSPSAGHHEVLSPPEGHGERRGVA